MGAARGRSPFQLVKPRPHQATTQILHNRLTPHHAVLTSAYSGVSMPNLRALPLLLLLFIAGCATPAKGPVVGAFGPSERLQIRVENSSVADLRVFVLSGNSEFMLGRVEGLGTTNLYLPEGLSGPMNLVARPSASRAGSDRHLSEPFTVASGQRVEWKLQGSVGTSDIPQISSIAVFGCFEPSGC